MSYNDTNSINKKRLNDAVFVTILSAIINTILGIIKIIVGILGNSSALVADGIHSFSDLPIDFALIIGFKTSVKSPDEKHNYGHGKIETLLSQFIGIILLIIGIGIIWISIEKIIYVIEGNILEKPHFTTLIAALMSIITKEFLYHYTKSVGKRINSQAIIINAWHHRSDALSSVATLIGIGFAFILGDEWTILDPIAGIIISLIIFNISIKTIWQSVREFIETSIDESEIKNIKNIIESKEEVKFYHNLKTRKIGRYIAIDLHIKVEPNLTVEESHNIASDLENDLKRLLGYETIISIHVEPFYKN